MDEEEKSELVRLLFDNESDDSLDHISVQCLETPGFNKVWKIYLSTRPSRSSCWEKN